MCAPRDSHQGPSRVDSGPIHFFDVQCIVFTALLFLEGTLHQSCSLMLIAKLVIPLMQLSAEAPGAFEPSHHCSRRCGGIFCHSSGQFHHCGGCGSPAGRSPGVTHSLTHWGFGSLNIGLVFFTPLL
eukprot:jgi/Botrbrau1/8060/Bobra.13_2s0029.1